MSIEAWATNPAAEQKWALLKPVVSPPRHPIEILDYRTDPSFIVTDRADADMPMGLDIETAPNTDDEARDCFTSPIVGLGLSDDRGSVYFDCNGDKGQELLSRILTLLAEHNVPLVAHNMFFEATFLGAQFPKADLNWHACTYAAFKLLATEGWPNQKWSIKHAMTHLLGWKDTNERALDNWLIDNGHEKNRSKEKKYGYYWRPQLERWVSPNKGRMGLAPAGILGPYCAMDADACFQLWQKVLLPVMSSFGALENYFLGPFSSLYRYLVRQKLSGITVDLQGIKDWNEELNLLIEQAHDNFLNRPEVRPHADERKIEVMEAHAAKQPAQYLKVRYPKEPKKHKKNGDVSQSWLNWAHKTSMLKKTPPTLSKNWIRWEEKRIELAGQEHLNLRSGPQMQDLVYNKLGFPKVVFTDKGQPSTGKKATALWGDFGRALKLFADRNKEKSYVEAAINHSRLDPQGNFRIHPSFRVPGTLTGRLAGSGGLNLQQVPKSREYLRHWRPMPGRVWVDVDFTSLEQVVLAELSKDPTLWKLYGPDAAKNDVYLFNGSQLPGIVGERLRAHGYDPDAPDPAAIAATKKHEKMWRQVAKVITLGQSYGMGPKKLTETLKLQGIDISENQAYEMWKGYWELYAGVKEYEKELLRQFRKNKGWVLNGIGRPVGIYQDLTKDIVNRVVQSTGHDMLVYWVDIFTRQLDEAGIKWEPVVIDFHDEAIVECDEADGEKVLDIMLNKSFDELNDWARGEIPLTGDGEIIADLSVAKCEG